MVVNAIYIYISAFYLTLGNLGSNTERYKTDLNLIGPGRNLLHCVVYNRVVLLLDHGQGLTMVQIEMLRKTQWS